MKLKLGIRWHLGANSAEEVAPQLFLLLHAIREGGSVRVAAEQLEMSYRHAWGLIKEWRERLGEPLVVLERGRGARLAVLGERLLWAERKAGARLTPTLESLASALSRELDAAASPHADAITACASHGLAICVLRDLVNDGTDLHMDLQFRGSVESLRVFSAGHCDLAGFHVPDGDMAEHIAPQLKRWLKSRSHRLVHVVHRQQGFMTGPGNPKRIASVRDLAKSKARFVNRQSGSGTRLIFDELCTRAGVRSESIRGYENEEFTHLAVAALVASGAADAGFGIHAAAAQFKLGFVPVVRERYCFAVRREMIERSGISTLVQVLRSKAFRDRVAKLPGYDPSSSGTILEVSEVLG